MPAPDPPVGKRLAKTLRRRRLLQAVVGGATIEQAAADEGIPKETAKGIIRRSMQELAVTNAGLAEHLRDLELVRMDAMQNELWPLIERRDAYVFCQGCGQTAPSADEVSHESFCGEPMYQLVPATVNLQAYDRILKISERRSKLAGLDSPTKLNVSGTVTHEHELVDDTERERLERVWRRRDSIEGEAVELEAGAE